jgi:hypothetical protein
MTDTGCLNVAPIQSSSALTATKTGSIQGAGEPGDSIIYQVTVVNNSTETLFDVTVSDPLVALSPAGPVDLAPSASFVASGNYLITEDDADQGSVVNQATVTAMTDTGQPVSVQSSAITSSPINPINPPGSGVRTFRGRLFGPDDRTIAGGAGNAAINQRTSGP